MYTVIHGRYIYIYMQIHITWNQPFVYIYIYGMTSFYTYTYIYTYIFHTWENSAVYDDLYRTILSSQAPGNVATSASFAWRHWHGDLIWHRSSEALNWANPRLIIGTFPKNFRGYNGDRISIDNDWLVVSTPPKNISQLGLLFPIYGKEKMFQTTNQMRVLVYWWCKYNEHMYTNNI